MTTSAGDGSSKPYNWLEQLTSLNPEDFNVWTVDTTIAAEAMKNKACLFPPFGLIAAIYIHFAESAQPDNEYHTLSHDVVFTMTLSKAVRMTNMEMRYIYPQSPIVASGGAAAAICYGTPFEPACPYHYHHADMSLQSSSSSGGNQRPAFFLEYSIGNDSDWFVLFKTIPEIFLQEGGNKNDDDVVSLDALQQTLIMKSCLAACEAGELRMVKFFLSLRKSDDENGDSVPILDINASPRSYDGSLLCAATRGGQPAMMKYLISLGALVAPGGPSSSAIHCAFRDADTEALCVILKAPGGCDVVNSLAFNMAPLHYAAMYRRFGAIRMLIDHGADVKVICQHGKNVLHYIAECAENSSAQKQDYSHAMEDIITFLVAPQQQCTTTTSSIDIDAVDKHFNTALHLAAGNGDFVTVEALLKCGASVNGKGSGNPMTPLQCVGIFMEDETPDLECKKQHCIDVLKAAGGI